MLHLPHLPFYDPEKTYEENFEHGPFGVFADGKIYKDAGEPQYDFLGQKVFSHFGIPSGPLINGNFVKAALDKGFDIVEYKDTRTHKRLCNPLPNIVPLDIKGDLTLEMAQKGIKPAKSYKEPLSITNSFGVPSMDPEFWQTDLREAVLRAKKGQVVVGGLQGTLPKDGGFENYLKDFILIAKMVKETGVKIIELNLSCPNEGIDNLLCFDVEHSRKVVEAVKKEIGDIPLIVKISYFSDEKHLEKFVRAVAPFVQAISAINTIVSKIVDENGKPTLSGGRLTSGTCGASIKWAGLEMVKKLKKLREKLGYSYTIVGVGGVMNADDFFEYRKAGADVVMSATGVMWNPYLAREIKERLR
ncbi:MAG: tRNA-dihydrouridine synthase [Candidatus Nomurabacteria bacterium]|nr:tRNA-dihydrouridine synthase [Candidatus Nomurabacteria bacterium]